MSESDEYGDEFDDTEFLDAATQAEKENTPAFEESPRPHKRQKLGTANKRTAPIPRNKQQKQKARRAFASSDDEEDGHVTTPKVSDAESTGASGVLREERSATRRSKSRQLDHDDVDQDGFSPAIGTTAQKRKDRIHVPTRNLELPDMFYTQPPQEDSPPWKPRGAIWAKQTTSIGVHRPSEPTKWTGLDAMKTMSLPGRQSISSRPPPRSPTKSPSPVEVDESPRLPITNGAGPVPPAAYDFTQDLADLPSDAFASSSSSPQKQNDDGSGFRRQRVVAPQTGLRQTTLFGRQGVDGALPPSQMNNRYNFVVDQKREDPTHHTLDPEAIKTWVYPTNLGTIRDYQFNIVQRGLFNNLLVALPTGLGKTFIAATIMLNWFRWTKEAQIVFVAPTKPLVSQQVDACFHIVGIPRADTTMLTGGVSPALRAEEWRSKRVFFMTPQTYLNDLKAGYADPKKLVLLVVDEAHRATGSYAFVEVVSFLRRFNSSYRVLALTATPGADVESVQKVIDGLDISRVEIRTENSMDICNYVHQRQIEKHVFQNSDEMEMCMDLYSQALQPLVNTINGLNAYWSKNPCDLTPFGCQLARKKWMQEAGRNANQGVKSMVNTVFTILSSISQAMDLLKFHGMGPFYGKLKEFKKDSTGTKSKYKKQILESEAFQKLMTRLQGWVTDDNFVGHPKLEFLQEAILDHFVNAGNGENVDGAPPSQTRIMVFAHFRDSAEEINRILKRHHPMIRPRVFVGQAAGKNSEGMTQKDQLEAVQKFTSGTFNTLIATSIGEEGLDIGEVDLIICYDSKASPIRMLQRMGRTGRKRRGKIILLQMQGKEENDANKAKDSYEKMQELITNGSSFNFHEDISRRILPPDVKPTVDRRVVEIPLENSQQDWLPEPKKRGRMKKPPKVFHMPDGVLTGFVTAGRMDQEIVPKGRGKKAAAKVYPSEEVYTMPPLDSVLLDNAANEDLARRFQDVFDDDDAPMLSDLDYSHHADRQRIQSKPQILSAPGRGSRTFVAMMTRIHDMDAERARSLEQNVHHSDFESDADDSRFASDTEPVPAIPEDMWEADEDVLVSPVLPKAKAKAKPGPKPKSKPIAAQTVPVPVESLDEDMWDADEDVLVSPVLPQPKTKAIPVPKPKPKPQAVEAIPASRTELDEDMWDADEDTFSPILIQPKMKAKPGPTPKPQPAEAVPGAQAQPDEDMWNADEDVLASPILPQPKTKAKPGPKPKAKPKAVEKVPAPRGRPKKAVDSAETPVRQSKAKKKTPDTRTPNYRASALAQEGNSSSPPPTDPRFHVASQADTIGSDDTIGEDEMQDPHAYMQDSELASFIVEDEEDVEVPTSSLPGLSLGGMGRGTQALLEAARPKRAPRAAKLFTSDPTDDDQRVSSDSDDDAPLVRHGVGASKKLAFVVDSASDDEEEEEDAPVLPRQRARRVIEDDDDDDGD